MKKAFGPTEIIPGLSSIPSLFEEFMHGFPGTSFSPAIDVTEDKDNWYVKAEIPGMTQKDIKINLEDEILTIEGEKSHEEETKNRNVHRMERRYGRFVRQMSLPASADKSRAAAAYKDGVLTITFPKKEETKKRSINIDIK